MKKILLIGTMAVMLTACGAKEGISTIPSKDKSVADLACDAKMTAYDWAGTPVKFCYDKAWGEPVVTKLKAEAGSGDVLSFGTAENEKAPKIWLATKDFKPTNPADTWAKFDSINAMISDAAALKKQVHEAMGYDEKDISARKNSASAVRAIRADVGGDVNKIVYLIRDAYEEHDMVIVGGKDMAEAVDNFVFDLVL